MDKFLYLIGFVAVFSVVRHGIGKLIGRKNRSDKD